MIRPMLAGKLTVEDLPKLNFPILVSEKLDGLRCLAIDGQAISRSGKPFPNKFVQAFFAAYPELNGCDGELIIGRPNDLKVFENTSGNIMRIEGEPDFTYYVFDRWDRGELSYTMMLQEWKENRLIPDIPRVQRMIPVHAADIDQLNFIEEAMLDVGYEGLILRDPDSRYKNGRSTLREAALLKLKRFSDFEARIVGFEERQINNNEKVLNELGYSKRSSHKANKTLAGTLGAFICEGVTAFPAIRFNVGTGLDDAQRAAFWHDRDELLGKLITVTYFTVGVKDKPRFPRFKAFRDQMDV